MKRGQATLQTLRDETSAHGYTAVAPGASTMGFDERFQDLVQVGRGSMGTVYRAWDRATCDLVALKLLDAPSTLARFEREALVLAQLTHPNLVRYVAHGVSARAQPWLAMEWLEGEDLASRLSRGPLGIAEAFDLAVAIADGLWYAHERGFIHRDIKPSNLFLPDGDVTRAKVLDFGLARAITDTDAFTRTGALMGTLEYMAPEQAVDAKRVDARADVFSLGVVLYHALTHCTPFGGGGLHEILTRVISREVPPARAHRPEVPLALDDLIGVMLKKDPRKRPRDAGQVASILAEVAMTGHIGSSTPPCAVPDRGSVTRVMVDRPRPGSDGAAPPSSHTVVMRQPSR